MVRSYVLQSSQPSCFLMSERTPGRREDRVHETWDSSPIPLDTGRWWRQPECGGRYNFWNVHWPGDFVFFDPYQIRTHHHVLGIFLWEISLNPSLDPWISRNPDQPNAYLNTKKQRHEDVNKNSMEGRPRNLLHSNTVRTSMFLSRFASMLF